MYQITVNGNPINEYYTDIQEVFDRMNELKRKPGIGCYPISYIRIS
jgi:hypothetical protein